MILHCGSPLLFYAAVAPFIHLCVISFKYSERFFLSLWIKSLSKKLMMEQFNRYSAGMLGNSLAYNSLVFPQSESGFILSKFLS